MKERSQLGIRVRKCPLNMVKPGHIAFGANTIQKKQRGEYPKPTQTIP